MGFEILRIAKLKNLGDVARSAKHTFRDFETPNAIPERLHLNLARWAWDNGLKLEPADRVVSEVRRVAGLVDKRDKQAVPCVEYLVTASKETMNGIDSAVYLEEALKWIKAKHGADNVVCSMIHHDEKTPHLVVYVVPVAQIEEKVRKRSVALKGARLGVGREVIEQVVPAHTLLSAKHYFGGKDKLSKLQTEFHESVGVKHGLERGINRSDRRHIKPAEWYAKEQARLDADRKELEAFRADLDAREAKLLEDWKQFEADKDIGLKLLAGVRAKLDRRDTDLKVSEAGIAEDFQRLEKVTIQQDTLKAGLDKREVNLKIREDGLIARIMTEKIEPLNARMVAFKQDRTEFRKELVMYQDMTKGYTPGQIETALNALDKIKSQSRGM